MTNQTSGTQIDTDDSYEWDGDFAKFFARNGIVVQRTSRPATAEDVEVAAIHAAERDADEAWMDEQAEKAWMARQ